MHSKGLLIASPLAGYYQFSSTEVVFEENSSLPCTVSLEPSSEAAAVGARPYQVAPHMLQ